MAFHQQQDIWCWPSCITSVHQVVGTDGHYELIMLIIINYNFSASIYYVNEQSASNSIPLDFLCEIFAIHKDHSLEKKIVHWTLSKYTPKSSYMLSTCSICITKTHLWPLISHSHYLEICILPLLCSLALSMDVGSVLEWLPCLHFTENMFLFSLILAQWFPKKATSKINRTKCLLQRSWHSSHC